MKYTTKKVIRIYYEREIKLHRYTTQAQFAHRL